MLANMPQITLKAVILPPMVCRVTTIHHRATLHNIRVRRAPFMAVIRISAVVKEDIVEIISNLQEEAFEVAVTFKICIGTRIVRVVLAEDNILETLHHSKSLSRALQSPSRHLWHNKVALPKPRLKLKRRMKIFSDPRRTCKSRIHRKTQTMRKQCHHQLDRHLQAHNPISSALLSRHPLRP